MDTAWLRLEIAGQTEENQWAVEFKIRIKTVAVVYNVQSNFFCSVQPLVQKSYCVKAA